MGGGVCLRAGPSIMKRQKDKRELKQTMFRGETGKRENFINFRLSALRKLKEKVSGSEKKRKKQGGNGRNTRGKHMTNSVVS